jgi:enoyl-CoA hydratase
VHEEVNLTEDNILLVETKDHFGTLTLNRPHKRNALSPDLLIKLYQAFQEIGQNDNIRTIVLKGAGDKAFSSGYDIAAIPTDIPEDLADRLKEENPLDLALSGVQAYPYPVIAMLNGHAFGAGCELAASCDIRIAADDIKMGIPAAKLGLVYPVRGLMQYVQTIGISATSELLFTGRAIGADRALAIGLINFALPRAELESFTADIAQEIAGNAPLALKGTKRILNLIRRSLQMPAEHLQEAETIITRAFNSDDLKEGQAAFLDKRKPVFKGR